MIAYNNSPMDSKMADSAAPIATTCLVLLLPVPAMPQQEQNSVHTNHSMDI